MAISDDEAMLSDGDMQVEESKRLESSAIAKGKRKALSSDDEGGSDVDVDDGKVPQALPGAMHGHELDNLPW